MKQLYIAFGRLSVGVKVSLIGSIGLALVLTAISVALFAMMTREGQDRADAWVGAKVNGVVQAIDALDAPSQALASKALAQLSKFFTDIAYDQAKGEISVLGSVVDEANSAYVDMFAKQTGGVGMVFAKRGDGFVGVSSSIRRASDNKMVHGAPIGPDHPAYRDIVAGKTFSGRELVAGKYYTTRYTPLKDASDKAVGVLFAGIDLSTFQQSIEKAVTATTLFETGHVAIIDPKNGWAHAVLVSHPKSAGKLLKDEFPDARALYDAVAAAKETGRRLPSPGLFGLQGSDRQALVAKSDTSGWWVAGEFSDRESLASQNRALLTVQGLLLGAAVVLGGGLWLLLRVWLTRPLRALSHTTNAVAAGDLTQACVSERHDEIGDVTRAMEELRTKLQATLTTVRLSSEGVSTASEEIAAGNANLSSRTEQAAASLQQTAASMTQLTSTVRKTAESAFEANQLAVSASQAAAKGGEVVTEVVATMDQINVASRKITDIIAVIDGIAFQTNILALNAAVEAARAGEQGRGFAVVASEVRALAQRSADAAKEIKRLIAASTEKVDNGTRLVRNAGSAMTDLVGSVQRVAHIIGEITAATGDQSQGMSQVSRSVTDLDNVTQQNAALVEESAAAAEGLRQQARDLLAVLQGFRLEQQGQAALTAH
ncbi:MAG TPA: methyl-accepting chemotaxis protein [Burkholderiaceae bacterium]